MLRDPEHVSQVSAKVMGVLLGVTQTTLRDYVNKGVIDKLRHGAYDAPACIKKYAQYWREKGGGGETQRAKLTVQQERKLRLQNDRLSGSLIEVSDASAIFAEYASAFRAGVTALPGRCSSQLSGMSKAQEIRTYLNDEADELLAACERILQGKRTNGEAAESRGGGDVDHKTTAKKNDRRVGRREPHTTKGKRRARKVAK